MKIKNINGTSPNNCKCGTWISHWKRFSQQTITKCAIKGCTENATDGAHIQKANSLDMSWYIVPLCHGCNMKKNKTLELKPNIKLVSANKSKTCEKTFKS